MAAGKTEAPKKQDKAEAPAEGAQKKKKLFLFIGLGVLLVAVSVGATFFVVSKMMAGKTADAGEASEEASSTSAEAAIYYPLKPSFTVNYDVNGRQRFLQAELTLMYRDPALLATLELHMPALRNSLVMLLSSQVFDDLQTAEGKENLRLAALTAVQDIIAQEARASAAKAKDKDAKKPSQANVEQVLFTQFVMQ